MGQVDGDGVLWLRGRMDRMIRIGEVSVHPETIEAQIAAMPGVGVCAVLPRPDTLRGQHLVAVLDGPETPTLPTRVRDVCRAALGAVMTPRHVLCHPDLPLLGSGKPDLVALARWLEDRG
jgi:long-chain acyl-CoA synthetase